MLTAAVWITWTVWMYITGCQYGSNDKRKFTVEIFILWVLPTWVTILLTFYINRG